MRNGQFTTTEVAQMLHRAPGTISKLADKGVLKCTQLPSTGKTNYRERRFEPKDVRNFCVENRIPIPAPVRQFDRVLVVGGSEYAQAMNKAAITTVVASDVFVAATEIATGCLNGCVIEAAHIGLSTSRQIIARLRSQKCGWIAIVVPEDCNEEFDVDFQWRSPFDMGKLVALVTDIILQNAE